MKLTTIAMAAAFALSSTVAFAGTVHHRSKVTSGMSRVYQPSASDDGNPNGTADGPTTLSGTGSSEYGGSSPGTSGYN